MGNLAVYFLFQGTFLLCIVCVFKFSEKTLHLSSFSGVTIIETDVRLRIAAILTGLCIVGVLVTLVFQPTPWYYCKESLNNPIK